MADEADEVKVSVSVVVVRADNTVEITKAVDADLYDETAGYAGYAKCVAVPGLADASAAKVEGLLDLADWVKTNDKGLVIIHTSNAVALELGGSGRIGLTAEAVAGLPTITKKFPVLTDDPLKPLTVADLRIKGLVP